MNGWARLRPAAAPDRGADGGELERAADTLEVAPDEPDADHPVGVEVARLLEDPGERGVAGGEHAVGEHGVLPVVAPAVVGAHPHAHPPPVRARVVAAPRRRASGARGGAEQRPGRARGRRRTRCCSPTAWPSGTRLEPITMPTGSKPAWRTAASSATERSLVQAAPGARSSSMRSRAASGSSPRSSAAMLASWRCSAVAGSSAISGRARGPSWAPRSRGREACGPPCPWRRTRWCGCPRRATSPGSGRRRCPPPSA